MATTTNTRKNSSAKKVEPTSKGEPSPPASYDALRTAFAERYDSLSKRLQQMVRFALDHPNNMALDTVAAIARRALVQPSTVIRFARSFGYSGFSDMQRAFQASLLEMVPSYTDRARQSRLVQPDHATGTPKEILQEFCAANIASLRHLQNMVRPESLSHAVTLLAKASVVHVVGMRRSFPAASYLAYALSLAERRTHLLTGVGGMMTEQAKLVVLDDVLIAISVQPYAPETAAVVEAVAAQGVPVIAITDSLLSPIARHAKVCFEIHDAELRGFRSQAAVLCLAQSLVISVALKVAPNR